MRYTEILNEENANYESMVSGFRSLFARHDVDLGGDDTHPMIELRGEVEWAKRILKRKDRVVWYLRHARIALIQKILFQEELRWRDRWLATVAFGNKGEPKPRPEKTEIHQALEAIQADAIKAYEHAMGHPYPMITEAGSQTARPQTYKRILWTHYIGYIHDGRSPEIDSVRWIKQSPHELDVQLKAAEKATRDREEKENRYVNNQANDKVVISFPDGYQWVLLSRSGCEEEGKAMGHCGNVGHAGKNILSLRKPSTEKKARGRLKPYVTFILHKGGRLGEMKGRFNEKPARELHPYIIELLRNKLIKGIDGGGYMAGNNFSLGDLTPDQREALLAEKPQLAS